MLMGFRYAAERLDEDYAVLLEGEKALYAVVREVPVSGDPNVVLGEKESRVILDPALRILEDPFEIGGGSSCSCISSKSERTAIRVGVGHELHSWHQTLYL